ncbi:MAG: SusF/SusE family outer membrane protein, partial [Paludibacteraceae bacterium]|nr:SusF/SusE family outer membrane protein [Paludibacteraceae bacterium]
GATPQLTVADGTGIEDKGLNAYYPEVIYAIGSATPAGWTVNNAIEMRESAFNSGIFEHVLTLNTGELKFLHQKDWGAGYGATLANDPVNGSGVYTIAALDDSDKKFAVTLTDATDYKVTVNAVTSSMTLSYYPERLYIIGPAVGGWSWDNNAIEMTTSEEGIFTWAGTLSAGEMKFFTERDFGATAYGATVAGQEIAASGVYDLEKLGAEDKKFIAPVADVILTVDLKQMKLRSVPDTVTGISMVADDGIIRIYDMMGMLRITLPANENITDNLTKGIYIMVKGTETEKIIIR